MKEIKNNLTFLSEGTNKTSTFPLASRQPRFESFLTVFCLALGSLKPNATFYWVETAVQGTFVKFKKGDGVKCFIDTIPVSLKHFLDFWKL